MNTKKLAYFSALTAVALCLSWIESLFPLPLPVPGLKLGLTNLATLLTLSLMGFVPALLLTLARVLMAAFLFGSLSSAMYALCGALCSLCVMALLSRFRAFSLTGQSIAGGVTHNLAQLLVAMAVTGTHQLGLYLPVLTAGGALTGLVIGLIASCVRSRVKINL